MRESLVYSAWPICCSRFVYPDGTAYKPAHGPGKAKKSNRTVPPPVEKQPGGASKKRSGRDQKLPEMFTSSSRLTDNEDTHRRANDMINEHAETPRRRLDGIRAISSDSLTLCGAESGDLQPQQRLEQFEIKASAPSYLHSREDSDIKDKNGVNIGLRRNSRGIQPAHGHHGGSSASTALATMLPQQRKDDSSTVDFDVDRAFRRNRRKWELLEGMGSSEDGGIGMNNMS